MSIVSIVYLPEGIAIAADSRLTGSQTKTADGATTIKQFSISDNAQKIVLLNKCSVGIASVGDAIIGGKTISDYIRLFEINNITNEDTPEMVADKLLKYKSEYPNTIFLSVVIVMIYRIFLKSMQMERHVRISMNLTM